MKKIQFDQYGHLTPNKDIEITLEEMEFYFATNKNRRWLFNNYVEYINRFRKEVFPFFEQWINGSFVTQKINPRDIDFVTFLDARVFEKRNMALLEQFMSFNLERQGLDAYIAIDYPLGHPFFEKTQAYKKTWIKRFSKTKGDGEDIIYNKGFLKILFNPKT